VNQDRKCEPIELSSLHALGIARLDLTAHALPPTGSSFEGLESPLVFAGPEPRHGRLVDVFLAPLTPQ
jgi:hypothetical protein